MSKLCKPRRLWRPAVATQPPIADNLYLDGGDARPHSCAASQLAVGFKI